MEIYIAIGTISEYIMKERKRTGKDVAFLNVIRQIYTDGAYTAKKPAMPDRVALGEAKHKDFVNGVKQLYYPFETALLEGGAEYDYVPPERDVITLSQFWGTRRSPVSTPQTRKYFYLNYVMSGQALFQFNYEQLTLEKGSFLIVSPPAANYTVVPATPDSCLVPITVRKATFSKVFFSALTADDVLSHYFHKLLEDPDAPNYIVFQTKGNPLVERIVRQIFLENFEYDTYVNRSDIYWLNLLCINILRDSRSMVQHSSYSRGTEYAPIMKYIEHKYQTVTLNYLSEKFGYTVSHLSKVIKDYTGHTFTELLRTLRMEDAAAQLRDTNESIETIAINTGFGSADHFSRTFKKHFGQTPSQYRSIARTDL